MMVGFLSNLESLDQYWYSVIGSEWILVEEKFISLKSLRIWGCEDVGHDLVYWNADNSYFPILENLVLEGFSRLDGLPSIYNCSVLGAKERVDSFNKKV